MIMTYYEIMYSHILKISTLLLLGLSVFFLYTGMYVWDWKVIHKYLIRYLCQPLILFWQKYKRIQINDYKADFYDVSIIKYEDDTI